MALKALVFVLGVLGQYFGLRRNGFHVARQLVYYTNISNILITLLCGGLAFALCRHHRAGTQARFARWVGVLRFALAAGILLTFTVFSLLLTPMLNRSYLLSADNLLVHNAVPLLARWITCCLMKGWRTASRASVGPRAAGGVFCADACADAVGCPLCRRRIGSYYFKCPHPGLVWRKAGQLGVFWWVVSSACCTGCSPACCRAAQHG